jgi:uncharacterized membrane protein (UPF0127 family)
MGRKPNRTRLLIDPDTTIAVARVADRPLARAVGLLGRARFEPGDGLVIAPCHTIHTWFMLFPIDVLFIDQNGVVVRAIESLAPFNVATGKPLARTTIELPAGTLRRAAVRQGSRVRMEPA